jgi:hypothetical protein
VVVPFDVGVTMRTAATGLLEEGHSEFGSQHQPVILGSMQEALGLSDWVNGSAVTALPSSEFCVHGYIYARLRIRCQASKSQATEP